jgi:hypothetical protein
MLYTKNRLFFREYNLLSCYWAGFLAADGCIKTHNVLICRLSDRDYEHLDQFRKDIEYTGQLKRQYLRGNMKPGWFVDIWVCGAGEIVNDLRENFNVVPKKSLILQHPPIDNLTHQLAFVKGYIDGDGSISVYKYLKSNRIGLDLTILGTSDILNWIRSIFSNILGVEIRSKVRLQAKTKAYVFKMGNGIAYDVLKILEQSCDRGLKRKWDKIKEYEDMLETRWFQGIRCGTNRFCYGPRHDLEKGNYTIPNFAWNRCNRPDE